MKTRTVDMMPTFLLIAGAGIPAVTMAPVPAPVPIEDFSGPGRLNPRRCGADSARKYILANHREKQQGWCAS
ncbi:MAG: hypothetical protein U9N36_08580 [Euryarchaeota archaeon]|nr:hypothetical protein [Euryarchaeota archaeon]